MASKKKLVLDMAVAAFGALFDVISAGLDAGSQTASYLSDVPQGNISNEVIKGGKKVAGAFYKLLTSNMEK